MASLFITPAMLDKAMEQALGGTVTFYQEWNDQRSFEALRRHWDNSWMVLAPDHLLRPVKTLRVNVSTRFPKGNYGPPLTHHPV